jgi:hypothetical protein
MPRKAQATRAIGRKRRVLGRALLTLAVFATGLWAASGWWSTEYHRPTAGYVFQCGYIRWDPNRMSGLDDGLYLFAHDPMPLVDRYYFWSPIGTPANGDGRQFGFGVGLIDRYGTKSGLLLFLWPYQLVLAFSGVLVLRSGIRARRRALSNKCKSCNYDLTGLSAGATCPECGKGATTPAIARLE